MKAYKFIFMAAALMLLSACVSDNIVAPQNFQSVDKIGKVFHATVEQSETKAYVNGDLNVHWYKGDMISINETWYVATEVDNTTATFVKCNEEDPDPVPDEDGFFHALYSGDLTYSLPHAFYYQVQPLVMYAKSNDENLAFHNVCGFLAIALTAPEGGMSVRSITVSNNGKPLWGSFHVDEDFNAVIDKYDEFYSNSVMVIDEEEPVPHYNEWKFFIPVPPGDYDQLTITVDAEEGMWSTTAKNSVSIKRNTIYPMSFNTTPLVKGAVWTKTVTIPEHQEDDDPEAPIIPAHKSPNIYLLLNGGDLDDDKIGCGYAQSIKIKTEVAQREMIRAQEDYNAVKLDDFGKLYAYYDYDLNRINILTTEEMIVMPETCYGLFENYYDHGVVSVSTVSGLDKLNFSNVKDFSCMFSGQYELETLDLKSMNTGKAEDMSFMFCNCQGLHSLDVSGFETGNVVNMSGMFANCEQLTELDLTNFKTSKVEDMSGMFCGCLSLSSLNLANLVTSSVKSMNSMFLYCEELTQLDLSTWDTSNVEDMSSMFALCNKLSDLTLTGSFNTENVIEMYDMFFECYNLEEMTVSDKFIFPNGGEEGCNGMFNSVPSNKPFLNVKGMAVDQQEALKNIWSKWHGSLEKLRFDAKTYTKVEDFADGKTYVIVYDSGKNYILQNLGGSPYGMLTDGYLDLDDDPTTLALSASDAESLEWTATSGGSSPYTGYSLKNNGMYVACDGSDIILDEDFSNSKKLNLTGGNLQWSDGSDFYYVYCNASHWRVDTSSRPNFTVYKLVEGDE